ncbi:hypothetical protein K8I28_00175 [bacterium]|nr:hypothetical protein [bacterium]
MQPSNSRTSLLVKKGMISVLFLLLSGCFFFTPEVVYGSAEDCLMCHADLELEAMDGNLVGVNQDAFEASVHGFFDCTDCHEQKADYDDIPHYDVYQKVDCSSCHSDWSASFKGSFHGKALSHGTPNAPDCSACHGVKSDPHAIKELNIRTAETACQRCHVSESRQYDGSVHHIAAANGKDSPGCISCHPTHDSALPPSAGAVNNLCETCHTGAMDQVMMGDHKAVESTMSCASCHDVHATDKPHIDESTIEACNNCHEGYKDQFVGSVHEPLLADGTMNCVSCHKTHQVEREDGKVDLGCGACHSDVEEDFRSSAHRLGRLRGDNVAADCADCHNGHHVLAADDKESPVNHFQIPNTCGKCHTDATIITTDYVRLPISLPSYQKSVHGTGWVEGKKTAVCTDCHGTHDLMSASNPQSRIAKGNIATTCGQCHSHISEQYLNSVHGRAVAHGINDSPDCTDCHDEHLILSTDDPKAAVNPSNQALDACGGCHTDPEMAARYGLPPEVVESYVDSYHGWAIKRGGGTVAVCEDCHNTHDIRSILDPQSSIHPDNVVSTCGRCHENSNPQFAASYNHILARDKMGIHDWVRIIYIILIALVLGGMAVHNLLIFIHYLIHHYRDHKKKPAIRRMTKDELWQHTILAVTFIGLSITGFALRFPDSWWVEILGMIGMDEFVRALLHRILATLLVGASIYHVFFLAFTKRGHYQLKGLMPGMRDAKEAMANVGYYAGLSKKAPVFGMYDYTQKAEYWALIWGTAIMTLTGAVLLFPDLVTHWLPAWVVRVSETIHFYEAILAVGAIIIWHFFFTIFTPPEYPMSWIWITGRMPKDQWEHHHGKEAIDMGKEPEALPPVKD